MTIKPLSIRVGLHVLVVLVVLVFLVACQPMTMEEAPTAFEDTATLSQETGDVTQEDGVDSLLQNASGEVLVNRRSDTGTPNFLRIQGPGDLLPGFSDRSTEERGILFFEENGGIFGITDVDSELALVKNETDFIGTTALTYQQLYEGVEVFGGELQVRLNQDKQITSVNGMFITSKDPVDTVPSLRAQAAVDIAIATVAAQHESDAEVSELSAVGTKLYIYQEGLLQGLEGPVHLVYEVEVTDPSISIREFLYIDAHTGEIVEQITGIQGLNRRMYDREFGDAFLVWEEGDVPPNSDADLENLIAFAEDTYNLFATLTNGLFLSWNGTDGTMHSVNDAANLSGRCPNARWNGQLTEFCRDVTSDDIVAHEWSHAYSQSTHGLIYAYESGALNEAYSDVFGELVDLLNNQGTDTPNVNRTQDACSTHGEGIPQLDNSVRWLVGEDSTGFGGAIRDMWNPTCYGHPGKVSDIEYHCGELDPRRFDNGGVHYNSGVPNHAFALLVDGGTYNGINVGGIGVTKAAHLYWRAATIQVNTTDFPAHAEALETACNELEQSGADLPWPRTDTDVPELSGEIMAADDCTQVANAISAVELRSEPLQCPLILEQNPPELCPSLGTAESIFLQDWEAGLGTWTTDIRQVANPSAFDTPDWAVVDTLPDSRPGSAAFVRNLQSSCFILEDETGVLFLDSPEITIPANVKTPRMAFTHWIATEFRFDGGNVKIKVNDGDWHLVPESAFSFNGYNTLLRSSLDDPASSNPLGGERAFTGRSAIDDGGNWGQSHINLLGLAGPGDKIQLRFESGQDRCSGVWGWYIDDVNVYSCSAELSGASCGNGLLDVDETCDDGNSDAGDGCSATCVIEDGWSCTPPKPPTSGMNVVADGSFEAGPFGGVWTESSASFGSPICSVASCPGLAPSDGTSYVWFGGIAGAESASVQQEIVVPTTATTLEFDLSVRDCDSTDDYMNVYVDEDLVFTTDPCTPDSAYSTRSVNIAPFADVQEHALLFESETFAINGGPSSFIVDNVVIDDNEGSDGQPSICIVLEDDPTVDQSNDPETGLSNDCGDAGTPLFQSFIPTRPTLSAVALRLRTGGSFPDDGINSVINIRAGDPTGEIVGSAEVEVSGPLQVGSQLLVRYSFAPSVMLIPGDVYVIEWLSPAPAGVPAGTILSWMGRDDDPYPRGMGFGCSGVQIPSDDRNFSTFSDD